MCHNKNLPPSLASHLLWSEQWKRDMRYLKKLDGGDMYWINLAQDRDRRRAVVNAVMNL